MARRGKFKVYLEHSTGYDLIGTYKTWAGAKKRARREAGRFIVGSTQIRDNGTRLMDCKGRFVGRSGRIRTTCVPTKAGWKLETR